MARSRRGMFRGNGNRGNGGVGNYGSGDVRRRRTWNIGGTAVTTAGNPAAQNSWGGEIALATGATYAFQAVTLQPAPNAESAPPLVGEVVAEQIQGSIFFSSPNIAGRYYLGIGIFISKFNSISGVWEFRDPSTPTDAAEDDWLFLRMLVINVPLNSAETVQSMIEVPLAIPRPVVVGKGMALQVQLCSDAESVAEGQIVATSYFRTLLSQVA